jgi:hypothetical protein
VRCYAQFWSREWSHNPGLYAEIIRVIFGPKVSPEEPRVRRCMNAIKRFYDEFHPLDAGPKVLELADARFMDSLGELAKTLMANKFLSPEFLFLSRTESGMCNLLHILKARVATTQIARQWMPPIPGVVSNPSEPVISDVRQPLCPDPGLASNRRGSI